VTNGEVDVVELESEISDGASPTESGIEPSDNEGEIIAGAIPPSGCRDTRMVLERDEGSSVAG
jgi:hypothetical protein